MAKNIKQIAEWLGAKIVGQARGNGGGVLDAAKLAHDAAALSEAAASEWEWIGARREDAEILDEIVEDALRQRRLQAWCPSPEDFAALEAIERETGWSLYELLDEAVRLLLERQGGINAGVHGGGSNRGDV